MSQISSQTHAISINPATGEQIGHYAFESAVDLDAALTRAAYGFGKWKRKPLQDRSRLLTALAGSLRDTADAMATMITLEMGKPIAQPVAKSKSAPNSASGTPNTARPCSMPNRLRSKVARRASNTVHSGRFWR